MGIAAYVKTLPSMPTKLPNVSFHFLLNIRVSFTLVLSMYNSFGLKNHFVSNNLQQCFKWIKKCFPLLQILECAGGVFPTLIPTIFVWQISITINLVAVHLTYSFFLLWFRMALFNATPKPKIVKKKIIMKILASIINYYRAHKKCGKSLLDGMWSPPSKYKLSIIQSQYQCSDIKKRKIKSFILTLSSNQWINFWEECWTHIK